MAGTEWAASSGRAASWKQMHSEVRSMKVRHRLRITWAGRTLRGRRLDRNPLRRRTDRAETFVILMLLVAFGCGAWFGAHAAARWISAKSAAEMRAQHTTIHQVRAVLLEQAVPERAYDTYLGSQALARWTAPDGRKQSGMVTAPLNAPIGSTVLTWVNRSGAQVTPLLPDQAAFRSDMAASATASVAGIVALLLGFAVHSAIDRRRLAAWDAEWHATGPRWTSRR
jgi:hypothetical protein